MTPLAFLFLFLASDSSSVAPSILTAPSYRETEPVALPSAGLRFQGDWIRAQFGLRTAEDSGAAFLIGAGVKSDVDIQDDGRVRSRSARKGVAFQIGVERSHVVAGPVSCHWQLGLGYEHLVASQGLDSSGIDTVRSRSVSKLDPSTGNYILVHYSPSNSSLGEDRLQLFLRLGTRIRLSRSLRLVGEVEAGPRMDPNGKSLSEEITTPSPVWLLGLDAVF